jgi:cytochrome P450
MTEDRPNNIELSDVRSIRAAYFESTRNAWIFSRHSDILEAFREPNLHPVGPRSRLNLDNLAENNQERLRMRRETAEALALPRIRNWQADISTVAQQILDSRAMSKPLELVEEFAMPICQRLAAHVTTVAPSQAENMLAAAAEISAAASDPFDESLAKKAKAAELQLRPLFNSGPIPLRESGFVALSQTLPHMLANVWFALIQQGGAWNRLHRQPRSTPRAAEELLRYAGLTRILFRMASKTIHLQRTSIQAGERIILRLHAAHQDPRRFHNPDKLDFDRQTINHFSLGAGEHACVAAPLIRMVLVSLTRLLVDRYAQVTLLQAPKWQGGSGFRFPGTIKVSVR